MADDFPEITQMIGGYLHQDMDLVADSVPGAIAVYAGDCAPETRAAVKTEMAAFLKRFHNQAEDEFARRWGRDFSPREIDQTVETFFAMVADILEDPAKAASYE